MSELCGCGQLFICWGHCVLIIALLMVCLLVRLSRLTVFRAAVCDIKPTSMEDLKEVITSAQYSPRDCCLLYYSTSQGAIKTADTRMRSVCDTPVAVLEESPSETSAATTTTAATAAASTNGSSNGNNSNRSFFTEITDSISDFK